MNVLKLKMEVLEGVMQTEDEDLLEQLKNMLSSNTGNYDFADDLPPQQVSEIKKGIQDAAEGKVMGWDEAMDKLNS